MKRRNFLQSLAIAAVAPKIITEVAKEAPTCYGVDIAKAGKDASSFVLYVREPNGEYKVIATLTKNLERSNSTEFIY